MMIEVMSEIAIYLGIVFGVPIALSGLFRAWQVFRPVKRIRRWRRQYVYDY